MGRDDHHPVAGGEFADEPQYFLDLDEVQVRGGLVGQHQGRIECDRPRDRDALLLTTAQISGPVRHPFLEPDPGEQLPGALVGGATRQAGGEQGHHHVLQCGEARYEIERLKHDADGFAAVVRHPAGIQRCHIDVAELDGTAGGPQYAAQAGQQCRLSATAGTQQDHQ